MRHKILSVPAVDPGSVAGFEYEQRDRPFLLQHVWDFQQSIPVRKARLILQLPAGWEFKSVWRNIAAKQPVAAGNQWTWELENVPAVELENSMPAWRAVAAQMALTYLARGPDAGKSHANWRDVGAWYGPLAATRLAMTPEVARKTAEVVAGAPTQWKKIEALAGFVQRQIRYVAIPIGIGSHQPHAAAEVLTNRYGDCKDKADSPQGHAGRRLNRFLLHPGPQRAGLGESGIRLGIELQSCHSGHPAAHRHGWRVFRAAETPGARGLAFDPYRFAHAPGTRFFFGSRVVCIRTAGPGRGQRAVAASSTPRGPAAYYARDR